MKLLICSAVSAGLLAAQAPNPTQNRQTEVLTLDKTPIYRVTVVSRAATAINYRHRSGATKVDFRGTPLMPRARGEAKVESKQGYIEIEVEFDDIAGSASQFGPEYLTYVLWAITPEGRAQNLGEILLNEGSKSKLNVTTELQAFGMIVTAEPYFAVRQPSDVVVMENVVRADTRGKVEQITANYELLQRGQYTLNVNRSAFRPVAVTSSIPLEVLEARNAVQLARGIGADRYATESFGKAENLLRQSEDYMLRRQPKPAAMTAREAVQTAEDAREIAIRRIEAERLEMERLAAAQREDTAKKAAEEAARQRALAQEQQRLAEEQQRLEARRRAEAEQQRLLAEEQKRAEADRATRAEAERMAAEKARAAAVSERLAAEKAKAEAEAARAAALAQQQALQLEAEKARLMAAEADKQRLNAEAEKEKLRQQLLQQLNLILETRDTARGLIVNMSDVLFDTARWTLRPAAREKLARLAGIVLAHPTLRLEIEGHTDSVGSDAYNQRLSEQRASSVRDYLVTQGIPATSVAARGFGEAQPVASNNTAAGRQQNRRVELVVSGEVIGTKVSELKGQSVPR